MLAQYNTPSFPSKLCRNSLTSSRKGRHYLMLWLVNCVEFVSWSGTFSCVTMFGHVAQATPWLIAKRLSGNCLFCKCVEALSSSFKRAGPDLHVYFCIFYWCCTNSNKWTCLVPLHSLHYITYSHYNEQRFQSQRRCGIKWNIKILQPHCNMHSLLTLQSPVQSSWWPLKSNGSNCKQEGTWISSDLCQSQEFSPLWWCWSNKG